MKRPKALYYYAKRFFSKLLIVVVSELNSAKANATPELQSLSVIAINDSEQPLTATLNCRLLDLFGNALDKVAFPLALGPFSTSAPMKQKISFFICPTNISIGRTPGLQSNFPA
jgi:hypothetical protein